QQLRLQQFADPGDLVTRQSGVRIGEKSMRGEVARVRVNRTPPFHQGELLKAQVSVHARQTGAARREVRVELQARAVDRPVVVQFYGLVQILQSFYRSVGGLLGDRVVEPWRGVLRVQPLGRRILTLV